MNFLKYFPFLWLVLFGIPLQGQSLAWADPVPVASPTYGFSRPRVVVTGSGVPVFLWSHEAQHKLYVGRYENGQMSVPLAINPAGTDYFGATWAGPEMAVHGEQVFVVGKEQPEDQTGVSVFRSEDGGKNFTQLGNVDWAIGDDLSRFPDVAAGPDGRLQVAFMRFDPDFSNARYVVSTSQDAGDSFTPDINASLGLIDGDACDCCPAQLAGDGDRLALIFRNNLDNIRTIWAGLSSDAGDSFDEGQEVDLTQSYFASCPATAPDGYWIGNRLLTTFRAAPGNRERVFFSVYDPDSAKVILHQYLTNAPDALLTQNHPRIAGNRDTILLVWEEAYAGNLEVKYRFTTDGPEGLVAAPAQTLNKSSFGNQFRPDVFWDGGKFHIVYQDAVTQEVIYRQGVPLATGIIPADPGQVPCESAYPNPATGLIHYPPAGESSRVTMVDPLGRIVQTTILSAGESEIPVGQGLVTGGMVQVFRAFSSGRLCSERVLLLPSGR